MEGLVNVGPRKCAIHEAPAASPFGWLRPSHDGTDLVERHGEHIMQDERKAFRGRQGVEHDKQRHADRVREYRFAFGIGGT